MKHMKGLFISNSLVFSMSCTDIYSHAHTNPLDTQLRVVANWGQKALQH